MGIKKRTHIRGVGLLNGVTIGSPRFSSTVTQKENSFLIRSKNQKPMRWGFLEQLRSLANGMEGLGVAIAHFSEKRSPAHSKKIIGTVFISFALGGLIFVTFPKWMVVQWEEGSHLAPFLRVSLLLCYLFFLRFIPDIRNIFMHQGAVQRAINCFEAGEEVIPENCEKHDLSHPFGPSSFLLLLLGVGIVCFGLVLPSLGLERLTGNVVFDSMLSIGIKVLLLIPLAAFIFEWIRVFSKTDAGIFKVLILPQRFLDRFVTLSPNEAQQECAAIAFRHLMRLEKGVPSPLAQKKQGEVSPLSWSGGEEEEFEISGLSELGRVQSDPKDFVQD